MPEIVTDSRESRSPVYAELHRTAGVTVVVRELACGDYVPHPKFGVERKDANDFVLSIMDRRLFAQVRRMKNEFERVLFLIEGDIYKTRSGMPPDAIRGALSYLVAIEGVSVITVGGVHETASLLATLARHLQEGLGYEPPLHANKPKNLADISEYIVSALPGIGTTTARTLLAHLGSAEAVLTSSVAQLCSVPGVGKKTAERIREALLAKAGDAGAAV